MASREKVASAIRWNRLIFGVSVVNPLMALPQLIQIFRTQETAGISVVFLLAVILVQGGFSLHGYFMRDRFVMISNGMAALSTVLVVASIAYFGGLGA